MSKPNNDTIANDASRTVLPVPRSSDDAGALSLVSCGITFFQFFQHLQEQKIPDNAQAVSAWRWSIRAPSC
jgi:hypothetical protein